LQTDIFDIPTIPSALTESLAKLNIKTPIVIDNLTGEKKRSRKNQTRKRKRGKTSLLKKT